MKNLINEEIKKFMNENYGSGNKFSFSQTLQGVEQLSFYNYHTFSDEYDVDIVDGVIVLKWNLIVNLKEWGVNGFDIDVSGVEGTYILKLLDKQTDEIVQETEKNIAEIDWNFITDTDGLSFDNPVYAIEMSFDFNEQKCVVSFV